MLSSKVVDRTLRVVGALGMSVSSFVLALMLLRAGPLGQLMRDAGVPSHSMPRIVVMSPDLRWATLVGVLVIQVLVTWRALTAKRPGLRLAIIGGIMMLATTLVGYSFAVRFCAAVRHVSGG